MSDSPEVRPALTEAEWAQGKAVRPGSDGLDYVKMGRGWVTEGFTKDGEEFDCGEVGFYFPSTRHALAALCLHDHPAGFGWEDVELLRSVADYLRVTSAHGDAEAISRLRSLADRIASMLPPKEE